LSAAGWQVIGAGPAGCLLSLLLAQRGAAVTLYERRPDPRSTPAAAGRSINLALAARGMRALAQAGVLPALQDLLVPMRGRMLHAPDGTLTFTPYGQNEREIIHSISRAELTRRLVEAAGRDPRIELRFEQSAVGIDTDGRVLLRDERTGREYHSDLSRSVAADGAGSVLRHALAAAGRIGVREALLDHDYKELRIAPAVAPVVTAGSAGPQLAADALHIWPRGGHMLIALPNADGSFTATLFLPRHGPVSFDALSPAGSVRALFAREFADTLPLLPDLEQQVAAHPQGILGTVYCDRWQVDERLLLIGDAAHAIVPFHGQGMNCAFEDCRELDALLADAAPRPFERFQALRRPDTDAIAQMALENYAEMRDAVRDPRFHLQKSLELALERRFPTRFVPRYSMVMFHDEIRYSVAQQRGALQQEILERLTARDPSTGAEPTLTQIDWALAQRLVESLLPPLSGA
jgi:kynurenine 3-monooxygenase